MWPVKNLSFSLTRKRLQHYRLVLITSLVWFFIYVFLMMYFIDCSNKAPCPSPGVRIIIFLIDSHLSDSALKIMCEYFHNICNVHISFHKFTNSIFSLQLFLLKNLDNLFAVILTSFMIELSCIRHLALSFSC